MDKAESDCKDSKSETNNRNKEIAIEEDSMVELREERRTENSLQICSESKMKSREDDYSGKENQNSIIHSDEEKENARKVVNCQGESKTQHGSIEQYKNDQFHTVTKKQKGRKYSDELLRDDNNHSNNGVENKHIERSHIREDDHLKVNKLTEKNLRMFNKLQNCSIDPDACDIAHDVNFNGFEYERHMEQKSGSCSPVENVVHEDMIDEIQDTKRCISDDPKNSLIRKCLPESKSDMMQFAELLYKCTLCTTIPSILTSRSSFIKHVTENHLTVTNQFKVCKICCLKFRTEEDVRKHVLCIHSGSERLSPIATGNDVIKHDVCNIVDNESDSDSSGHRSYKAKSTKRSKPHVSDYDNPKQLVDHAGIETLNGSLDLSRKDLKVEESNHESKSSQNFSQEKGPAFSKNDKNTFNVQQITDQIIKSNLHGRNISVPKDQRLPFIPSYTPEFGKYTKLVREGGNIVYFCQVCNSMSPVKAHFQAHCSSVTHASKVKSTHEQEQGDKFDGNHKDANTDKKSTNLGRYDMNYGPSSHPSILNIPNTSHFSKIQEVSMFYSYMRPRPLTHCGRTPVVTGHGFQDRSDLLFQKQLDNSGQVGALHRKRKRAPASKIASHTVSHHSNSDSDSDGCSNTKESQSKCSKTSMSLLRNKLLHGQTDEGYLNVIDPSHEGDDLDESAQKSHKSKSDKNQDEKDARKSECRAIKRIKVSDTLVKDAYKVSGVSGDVGNGDARISDCDDKLFKLYRCVSCPFEYSSLDDYEEHFSKVHFGSSPSDVASNPSLQRLLTGVGGGSTQCPSESLPAKCSEQNTSPSVEMGENWRVQKLKEILPDFLEVNEKGNTSRDYLLQCISVSACIPDAPLWSSACNKAVREIFPNSLAQRKGKYKKTYYFGLSMAEMFHGQEDVSPLDADGQIYQPIRDINADIEKLMEHLPAIIHWNGCMDEGIYRADILTLLADILEEPDILNWGTQCNRAIKLVFPMLDMKRKGKFKTKYFGVSFNQNIGSVTGKQMCTDLSKRTEQDHSDDQGESLREKTHAKLEIRGGNSSIPVLDNQASEKLGHLVPVFPQWFKVEAESQMEQYLTKFGGVFENSNSKVERKTEDEDNDGDDEGESIYDEKDKS